MIFTTYIIDDELPARERLSGLLQQFFNGSIEIKGMSGQPAKAINEVLKLSPDLLFLDIEMPCMSGLELAQKLRSKGYSSEEIAAEMFLSRHTVDTHRRNILIKTGARNTVELLNMLRN